MDNRFTLEDRSKITIDGNLGLFRSVMGDSNKVYFMFSDGFLHSFHGQYDLIGYFNPHRAWVFKNEQIQFLQELIDTGYFIVFDENEAMYKEYDQLVSDQYKQIGQFLIIWN